MSAASLRPSFYSPSGLVPIAAWIMVVTILVPLALVSGIVYCAAVVFIPMVKLRWIASVGLGWALGGLTAKICRLGKVRATLFVALAAGVAVAAGYYASWGVHRVLFNAARLGADVQFNQDVLLGFLPGEIARWMRHLVRNGGGANISGLPLIGLWLIELAAIVYFTRATFLAAWDERPFCEQCDRWTTAPEEIVNLPVSASDPAWQRVIEVGPEAIRQLQLTADANERVVLSVSYCPECDRSNYLSASGGGWEANEQGETSFQETVVVRNMAVTPRQIEDIKTLGEQLDEAYRELNQDRSEVVHSSEIASYSDATASSP